MLYAADDGRAVGVANFFRDYSDGVGALVAQRAGEKIGSIIKFLRSGVNPVLGLLRNRAGRRRIIENRRYRTRSEPDVLSDGLQRNHRGLLAGCLDLAHD